MKDIASYIYEDAVSPKLQYCVHKNQQKDAANINLEFKNNYKINNYARNVCGYEFLIQGLVLHGMNKVTESHCSGNYLGVLSYSAASMYMSIK